MKPKYTTAEIVAFYEAHDRRLEQAPVDAIVMLAATVCKLNEEGNEPPLWELLELVEGWMEKWKASWSDSWPNVNDVKEWLDGEHPT